MDNNERGNRYLPYKETPTAIPVRSKLSHAGEVDIMCAEHYGDNCKENQMHCLENDTKVYAHSHWLRPTPALKSRDVWLKLFIISLYLFPGCPAWKIGKIITLPNLVV